MPIKQRSDYNELLKKAQELIKSGKAHTLADISRALNIQRASMMALFERNFGILKFEDIMKARPKAEGSDIGANGKPLIGPEHADKFEVEIDGNEGVIRSVTVADQITSIPQLLKKTKTDDEFIVHNPTVKKWDVVLKVKEDKDKETVTVVPSIYIEAPLRRKKPIAFEPVISPIEIDLPKLPKPGKHVKGVKRALIINDPQIGFRRRLHTSELTPFHDRRVLDLALQICQEEEIDHISLGGDVNDYSEWSNKFMAEPEFYWTTQPALLETAWWLTQLRLARPHAEMKMLEGNHDLRMPLLVLSNLKQAYRLQAVDEMQLPPQLTVARLLALHKLNVEYVSGYPNNGYWLNKNIHIEHGDVVRGAPGATASAVTSRQAYTTVFGHIHRRELVSKRLKLREGADQIYTAFCPGCVCHIDGRVPGSSPKDQWQQGLAVIEYTDDFENIIPIAIDEGRMIYRDRIWTARNRDMEVNKFLHDTLEGISG